AWSHLCRCRVAPAVPGASSEGRGVGTWHLPGMRGSGANSGHVHQRLLADADLQAREASGDLAGGATPSVAWIYLLEDGSDW
ncbi:unnamed protein product, partial [Bubo scandiacus]